MDSWYFPYGIDIQMESVNNAKIETFKDNIVESLGRESCQNSLDAFIDSKKPVIVKFEEKMINISDKIDKESFINIAIPRAKKTWRNDKEAQKFLKKYEDLLNEDKIKVLRISDYNTTGLRKENWEALINKAGLSVKDDIGSAGSFGIGKAAPFASSNLRMVFYNTKLEDGTEKSIGVTQFISFERADKNNTIAQGVGYLGEFLKEPFRYQTCFDFNSRKESGTDIFIIGYNQDSKWREKMIPSILENFMVSIYKGQLVVEIEDQVINRDSMPKIINRLKGKKYDRLKNYYSVLDDSNKKVHYLDDRFKKYGFKSEDGVLYLNTTENANRSVLMTRKAGMKILDRKNISGSIQFNGIFIALGQEINNILKQMENPNHNDWIPSRYEEDPKMAQNLLDDLYRFMKDNIFSNYQEELEETVDAFGISDFLPNRIKEDSKTKKEGILLKENIRDVELKEKTKKTDRSTKDLGDELLKDLEKSGVIEGGDNENLTPGDKPSVRKLNPEIIAEGPNKYKEDPESEREGLFEKYNKFKEYNLGMARVIEVDPFEGNYRIVFKTKKYMKALKVELRLIGESGSGYSEKLENVFVENKNTSFRKNSFIIERVKANKLYSAEINIPYKNRVKMEVRLYENQ